MAKIPFGKLKLKKQTFEPKIIEINGVDVEVVTHLDSKDYTLLVSQIISQVTDGGICFDPIRFNIYFNLNVVKAYTNLTFTEKQQEDTYALFDLLQTNQVFQKVDEALMDSGELAILRDVCEEGCYAWFDYKNSFSGSLMNSLISTEQLTEQSEEIRKNLADPDNLALLKDVIQKMP